MTSKKTQGHLQRHPAVDALRSERGIALPLALQLLIALGFVATAATFMSNSNTRITANHSIATRAMAAAEAAAEHGVVELTARSQAGQDPDGVQILTGTLGRFTYTVTAFSKREEAEGGGGRDFNGDGDTMDVVLYDQRFGYAGAEATGATGDQGLPVKLLVARATDGQSSAEVRLEMAMDRPRVNTHVPLTLNSPRNVILSGSFDVDGRLHSRNGTVLPSSSLSPAYGNNAASKSAAKSDCDYWKAGVRLPAGGIIELVGAASSTGHVAFDHGLLRLKQNYDAEEPLSSFKLTPEEVLGVPAGGLDQWEKAASEVPDFKNLSGVTYVTSGSVPSQIAGSGILIVHNPSYDVRKYDCLTFPTTCQIGYRLDPANQPMELRTNANSTFSGIIITDTMLHLGGNFELLGGMVSLTTENVNLPAFGNASLKWSCEAVRDAATAAGAYSVRLSWQSES